MKTSLLPLRVVLLVLPLLLPLAAWAQSGSSTTVTVSPGGTSNSTLVVDPGKVGTWTLQAVSGYHIVSSDYSVNPDSTIWTGSNPVYKAMPGPNSIDEQLAAQVKGLLAPDGLPGGGGGGPPPTLTFTANLDVVKADLDGDTDNDGTISRSQAEDDAEDVEPGLILGLEDTNVSLSGCSAPLQLTVTRRTCTVNWTSSAGVEVFSDVACTILVPSNMHIAPGGVLTVYVKGISASSAAGADWVKADCKPITATDGTNDTATDGVRITVVSVGITETWSDQLAGVKANFMPGGTGGKNKDYMIIGARSDDRIHVKGTISIVPDHPTTRPYVLVGYTTYPSGLVPNPGATTSISGSEISLVTGFGILHDHRDLYALIAGVDNNKNGVLDLGEASAFPDHPFRCVHRLQAIGGVVAATLLLDAGLLPFPYASANLAAFIRNTRPAYASGAGAGTLVSNDQDLEHAIGAGFNAARIAVVNEYKYSRFSDFSEKILDSNTIAKAARSVVDAHKTEILADMAARPRRTSTYVWPFDVEGLDYDDSGDTDIWLAIGKAHFSGKLRVEIKPVLTGSGQIQSVTLIEGVQTDLYDWDYDILLRRIDIGDRTNALIQAGFPTIHNQGRVYREKWFVTGSTTNRFVYGTFVDP